MALNNSNDDVVLMRRERVASLRARGLTVREIVATLADPRKPDMYMINPDTGVPYTIATIHGDIKTNQRAALKRSEAETRRLIADQLAETAEVKRVAWSGDRLDLVLRALEREAKLLGLDAPMRHELISQMTEIERLAAAAGISMLELLNELKRELSSAPSGAPSEGPAG